MSLSQSQSFDARLARLAAIREGGDAFVAHDTVTRRHHEAARRPVRPTAWLLRPVAMLLAGVLLFKGALYGQLGAESYALRVAHLEQGNFADRAAAWVMRADGVTVKIGQSLHPLLY